MSCVAHQAVLSSVLANLQELETLIAYLGLDWSHEEVDGFLSSKGSHGLLQFMATFVRIIEQVRCARGTRYPSRTHTHCSCVMLTGTGVCCCARRARSRARRR